MFAKKDPRKVCDSRELAFFPPLHPLVNGAGRKEGSVQQEGRQAKKEVGGKCKTIWLRAGSKQRGKWRQV